MAQTGFPSTENALIGLFDIKPGVPVGTLSTGAGLNYVRATGGKVESIDGYSGLKLRATVNDGDDWITVDHDGKRLRLDAKMLMKTGDGAILVFKYTGIITITPDIGKVLSGDPSAATVPFGNIVSSGEFKTGDARYKEYENNLFVGSGRFIVNSDKSVTVEYGLSKVVA